MKISPNQTRIGSRLGVAKIRRCSTAAITGDCFDFTSGILPVRQRFRACQQLDHS